jgi:hypothetical protein
LQSTEIIMMEAKEAESWTTVYSHARLTLKGKVNIRNLAKCLNCEIVCFSTIIVNNCYFNNFSVNDNLFVLNKKDVQNKKERMANLQVRTKVKLRPFVEFCWFSFVWLFFLKELPRSFTDARNNRAAFEIFWAGHHSPNANKTILPINRPRDKPSDCPFIHRLLGSLETSTTERVTLWMSPWAWIVKLNLWLIEKL